MPAGTTTPGPVVLLIRDGWGENPHREHDPFNAIRAARTPVADRLAREWPTTLIRTCGEDVGLPAGTMGNSEVGHQNIGAGRIVDQQLMRITRAIHDGSFRENPTLRAAFDRGRAPGGGTVHLLGLVSNGRVHSDLQHIWALIDLAAEIGVDRDRLAVHALMDGRDTPPESGLGFIGQLEEKLASAGVGRIASVIGRFYAMDRDDRWERIEAAYGCLTDAPGAAPATAASALAAVQAYYDAPSDARRRGDEFIPPTRIEGTGAGPVRPGDTVIFFNFRGDRPREITRAFTFDDEAWAGVSRGGFDRGQRLDPLCFCTLAEYETGLPVEVAFARPPRMPDILGRVIEARGLRQFRCAETEKFPHVTFFFNDYREEAFDGETRRLVPSPRDVMTYDQKPQMSAEGVCETVVDRLGAEDCESLIVVNFANADMVGHTGDLDATIRAVETVDACTGRVVEAVLARGGSVLVTADHGNAEQMRDPDTGEPHTAHTVYDVPFIAIGAGTSERGLREGGRLADIAPTVLDLLGIEPPDAMTGRSLLARSSCAATP